ncbi:hypothetical protein DAPPUDRAFT_242878 [Daphnia pulex]|uniref:Uncharacterized protein n=1 Tax=Daphnia pulex TaxID=6669 RepID=E9GHJ5_DAPPU|nr:hypothetical protein DAPPUDRAFT_242878 [Daphnia pulex]|eukprot:EFX81046.1 hypothetical protein DAPPUDRAFT_242878 [Daphnia pulex]
MAYSKDFGAITRSDVLVQHELCVCMEQLVHLHVDIVGKKMENFWWRLSEMISEQRTCSQVTADSKRLSPNDNPLKETSSSL